jgi:DNA polymerase/3'-5' exonuclease PolX
MFNTIATAYKMPMRIPLSLFRDILSKNDLVVVLLEHIDYLLKMKGRKSPFGYAAYSISQIKIPLSDLENDLRKIKGVGNVTERIILEIIKTGTSSYYEKLSKP